METRKEIAAEKKLLKGVGTGSVTIVKGRGVVLYSKGG
mgnify:CR=1 FL=1